MPVSTAPPDIFESVRKPKQPCEVPACERNAQKRGLCSAHYARWLSGGSVRAEVAIQVRSRPTDPLTCICAKPAPDVNGECRNRGCRRPFFSEAYQRELAAFIEAGGLLR